MRYLTLRPRQIVFLALLALSPIWAATASSAQIKEVTPDEATPEPGPTFLPPAYEQDMLRLAEILGSLHYLRDLCGAKEGQIWREQMEQMLEVEEPSADRKARLVARFNRGYRGFREIYRECTPAAAEAANRYLRQGMKIAGDIPNRYGR